MTSEEKKLAVMMMPTKKRKLYDKILHSKKQKAKEVGFLKFLSQSSQRLDSCFQCGT